MDNINDQRLKRKSATIRASAQFQIIESSPYFMVKFDRDEGYIEEQEVDVCHECLEQEIGLTDVAGHYSGVCAKCREIQRQHQQPKERQYHDDFEAELSHDGQPVEW